MNPAGVLKTGFLIRKRTRFEKMKIKAKRYANEIIMSWKEITGLPINNSHITIPVKRMAVGVSFKEFIICNILNILFIGDVVRKHHLSAEPVRR